MVNFKFCLLQHFSNRQIKRAKKEKNKKKIIELITQQPFNQMKGHVTN